MNLKEIYQPVAGELAQVEEELKKHISSIKTKYRAAAEPVEYSFAVAGQRLRPALVILSARAAGGVSTDTGRKAVQLAAAVELVHGASLVHDDVVDEETVRRGRKSLAGEFGNKIAILSGDLLFSRAFLTLSDSFGSAIIKPFMYCIERMCSGEIDELNRADGSFEGYLKQIEDKTAVFMSMCCQCGALLAGEKGSIGGGKRVDVLREYGLNLGISYQLMDDFIDGDARISPRADLDSRAMEYSAKARENIACLDNTVYSEALAQLSRYVTSKKKEQTKDLSAVSG